MFLKETCSNWFIENNMLLHKSKLQEFLENKGTKHPILIICQPFKDPSENPQVTETHTSNACLKIQIHVVKIILKIIRLDHFNANLKTISFP